MSRKKKQTKNHTSVSIPNEIVDKIDMIVKFNKVFYKTRAEFVNTACKKLIRKEMSK